MSKQMTVLISDSNPSIPPDAYQRVIGNETVASIMQRMQSSVIRNGNELEHLIRTEAMEHGLIVSNGNDEYSDLDCFIDSVLEIEMGSRPEYDIEPDKWYMFDKSDVMHSRYNRSGHQSDYVFMSLDNDGTLFVDIIEMKDGSIFDTKKSRGEYETLSEVSSYFENELEEFGIMNLDVMFHICSFNAESEYEIIDGMKNMFSINEVITGKRFCDTFFDDENVFYEIDDIRKQNQDTNLLYFIRAIISDDEVRNIICDMLSAADD